MAQRRLISRSLGSSKKFHELNAMAGPLGDFAQALFPLLVVSADDFGRLPGDAFTVRFSVFPISPHSEEDFEAALQAMCSVGMIQLYESRNQRYIHVVNFEREQTGLNKRTKSRLPDPPDIIDVKEIPGNSRKFQEIPTQLNRTKQNGIEQNPSVQIANVKLIEKTTSHTAATVGDEFLNSAPDKPKPKPKRSTKRDVAADDRYEPLRSYVTESWQRYRRCNISSATTNGDWVQFAALLRRTRFDPALDLAGLKKCWDRFIEATDEFTLKQGLGYWSVNAAKYLVCNLSLADQLFGYRRGKRSDDKADDEGSRMIDVEEAYGDNEGN